MNREIKFRLHCEGTGQILAYEHFNTSLNWGYYWYDATLPEDDQICQTLNYFKHPHPITRVIRVEFTGLKDANGVEIYEGDIIRYVEKSTIETITKPVVFIDGGFLIRESEFCDMPLGGLCSDENHEGSHIGFVIGNIYQNPELLK